MYIKETDITLYFLIRDYGAKVTDNVVCASSTFNYVFGNASLYRVHGFYEDGKKKLSLTLIRKK